MDDVGCGDGRVLIRGGIHVHQRRMIVVSLVLMVENLCPLRQKPNPLLITTVQREDNHQYKQIHWY